MDEATAKRVLAERRRAKFRTPADLRERLRVSEDVAALLGRIVEF
jgi:predicted nucleic acid-binding OB-fold protein